MGAGCVWHRERTRGQPGLPREGEAPAVWIATADLHVREKLAISDIAMTTLHYWGRAPADLAFARRSAAVVFGRNDGHATLVVVVDLIDHAVTQVVPAELW